MSEVIKHFQFWLHVAEYSACNRLLHSNDPEYNTSLLAKDDRAHLVNILERLRGAFAGVPIGPAEIDKGVTNPEAVDPPNADPASKNST